jgi:hypothetical protein
MQERLTREIDSSGEKSGWMLQKRWEGRAATSNMSSAGGYLERRDILIEAAVV